MHHLGQPVDNNKNRVVAIAFLVRRQRQSNHKVHGEFFPPISRYRQGLQVNIGLISDRSGSQTNVIFLDIALNVSSQTWPIVFPADQLSCLVNTKMSYKKIIVVTTYQLRADDLWNIYKPLVLEQSLDVFPVLQKACSSKCSCFLIIILKFGRTQSNTSDVGNIRTVLSDLSLEGVPKLVELGQDSYSKYQDLIERRQVTRVNQKARYFGQ